MLERYIYRYIVFTIVFNVIWGFCFFFFFFKVEEETADSKLCRHRQGEAGCQWASSPLVGSRGAQASEGFWMGEHKSGLGKGPHSPWRPQAAPPTALPTSAKGILTCPAAQESPSPPSGLC